MLALHAVEANICKMTYFPYGIGNNSTWITRISLRDIIQVGLFGKEFMPDCVESCLEESVASNQLPEVPPPAIGLQYRPHEVL